MIRAHLPSSSRPARLLLATAGPCGAALLAGGLLAGCGSGPAATAISASPTASATARGSFGTPLHISNPLFPLTVGSQFIYQGTIVDSEGTHEHSVVFTVTDLVKHVDGTETVVALDQDFREGALQEQELAFFAQDDAGNVWNFGEYPEEYDNGKLTGAPSTWIRGTDGAYGGMHVLGQPRVGMQYREGLVPAIQFDDVSKVTSTSQHACVKSGCYKSIVVVDETSPNDPTSGHQIKYYAPGTGLVKVGANGGDSREFLQLAAVRHLSTAGLSKWRAEALAMDKRAYRVAAKIYRGTPPARQAAR
ncbi:MAG TPA: hypothetical protein VH589_02410 [Trebonia sp.]|jgi:hypothetical protein